MGSTSLKKVNLNLSYHKPVQVKLKACQFRLKMTLTMEKRYIHSSPRIVFNLEIRMKYLTILQKVRVMEMIQLVKLTKNFIHQPLEILRRPPKSRLYPREIINLELHLSTHKRNLYLTLNGDLL